MSESFLGRLEAERVESRLPDKKPLLSLAEARAESERCLYCSDAPCIKACPTEIDIPTFIKKIASDNVKGSARTIFSQNILGYACARVCPVEVLCEGSCVYTAWQKKPISIGRLQRYATETATADLAKPMFSAKANTGRKVACVGAGPASLACAAYLAMEGHHAVLLEMRSLPGGLDTTGVAPYKLHAEDALREVEWVKSLGVEIRTGVAVGQEVKGSELLAQYDAVFLGVGLGADNKLGVPGEDRPGVIGATAWIEEMKLARGQGKKLGRVVVVGGGNTAIDVARECAQLGADEVVMVYRRGREEMSGYAHELEGARKEGVRLMFEAQPTAFVHGPALTAMRVKSGSSEREIPCDLAVVAIGQSKLHALAAEFPGVALDSRGCVIADPKTGATGNPKVFAGGDCVNGGKEVVNAVADGRNAARALIARWGGLGEETGRREDGK